MDAKDLPDLIRLLRAVCRTLGLDQTNLCQLWRQHCIDVTA